MGNGLDTDAGQRVGQSGGAERHIESHHQRGLRAKGHQRAGSGGDGALVLATHNPNGVPLTGTGRNLPTNTTDASGDTPPPPQPPSPAVHRRPHM
jgi:hypothetical protein